MLYLLTKQLFPALSSWRLLKSRGAAPLCLPGLAPARSILAMVWLWRDTGDSERIAALSEGTFWLVLPTLPMFLVLPALRHGVSFWIALALSCGLTIVSIFWQSGYFQGRDQRLTRG